MPFIVPFILLLILLKGNKNKTEGSWPEDIACCTITLPRAQRKFVEKKKKSFFFWFPAQSLLFWMMPHVCGQRRAALGLYRPRVAVGGGGQDGAEDGWCVVEQCLFPPELPVMLRTPGQGKPPLLSPAEHLEAAELCCSPF